MYEFLSQFIFIYIYMYRNYTILYKINVLKSEPRTIA